MISVALPFACLAGIAWAGEAIYPRLGVFIACLAVWLDLSIGDRR